MTNLIPTMPIQRIEQITDIRRKLQARNSRPRRLPLSRKARALWNPRTLAKGSGSRAIRVELSILGNSFDSGPLASALGIHVNVARHLTRTEIMEFMRLMESRGMIERGSRVDADYYGRTLQIFARAPLRVSAKIRQRYNLLADPPKPTHQ